MELGVTHCDQCAKNCPVEALSCNRGRRRFGQELKMQDNETADKAQEKWKALRMKKMQAMKAMKEKKAAEEE